MNSPRTSPTIRFVVILLILLNGVIWYGLKKGVDVYDGTRFDRLASQLTSDITIKMQSYISALEQTKSMYDVKKFVSREDFKNYVTSLKLFDRYPGAQAIAYSDYLRTKDLEQYQTLVRRDGYPNFKVWPPGVREEYAPVTYIEPFDWRNQRAFGFDLFSEPIRREAMERARDTGSAALSSKVKLVQETNEEPQPGFILFVPIYKKSAVISTIDERRNSLAGFIANPFRAHDLFTQISPRVAERHLDFDFEIFDGPDQTADGILYDYDGLPHFSDRGFSPRFKKVIPLRFAGRPWTLVVTSLP